MLCGVNFQNNFIKGHNPLYFETQEGLISFENETYTFYWLAHLFNIIISIFLTFWIVLFLMLIQKSEKLISHLKNVSPINTSGQAHDTTSWFVHLFFSDISSSLWLHLRTSYWFQSDINIFYYFCGMEVNKLSFCIFTGFFFLFFVLLKICSHAFQNWHVREKISVLALGLGCESVLRLGLVLTCVFIQNIKRKL